jgi:hypothetical protein
MAFLNVNVSGAPGHLQLGGWTIIEKRSLKFFSNCDSHFHFWSLAISLKNGADPFFSPANSPNTEQKSDLDFSLQAGKAGAPNFW